MSNIDPNKQYEQLNQRSRWYSSQLWYVPFAFVGIISLGIGNIAEVPEYLKTLVLLMFSLFSLSAFVHVSSLKYYERKAVWDLRKLKLGSASGGAAWYMSFVFYIKIMFIVATIGFFWVGTQDWECWWLRIVRIVLLAVIIFTVYKVWRSDHIRNQSILDELHKNES